MAGVTVEISFARFKTWMRPFSVEMAFSRPFGRRGIDAMVNARGRYKRIVWHGLEAGRKKMESNYGRAASLSVNDTLVDSWLQVDGSF